MTVKELIDRLQECNPDATVCYAYRFIPNGYSEYTDEIDFRPLASIDFLDLGNRVSIHEEDHTSGGQDDD